mgnify:CR=1 FL=1
MKLTEQIEQQIYNGFISIESDSYQEQIRYYENNRSDIRRLPYEYQTYIECKFAIASYEVKDYYGFLSVVDRLITMVIRDNIYEIDGVDVYKDLLYRKAWATHRVLDYYKADHIFSELVKIDSDNQHYTKGYLKNSIEKKRYEVKYLNATSIILFVLAAAVICVEILMVRTFYKEWTQMVEYSRNLIFLGGILVLLFLEGWIRLSSYQSLKVLKQK